MAEEMPDIEVVYLGKRQGKSKVAHLFIPAETLAEQLAGASLEDRSFPAEVIDAIDRKASWYNLKSGPNNIGNHYRTQGLIENGSIMKMRTANFQWVPGSGEKYPQIAVWQAMHNDVELKKRRAAAEKRAAGDRAVEHAVNILKSKYRALPFGYRRGFQLWLLDELDKRK